MCYAAGSCMPLGKAEWCKPGPWKGAPATAETANKLQKVSRGISEITFLSKGPRIPGWRTASTINQKTGVCASFWQEED